MQQRVHYDFSLERFAALNGLLVIITKSRIRLQNTSLARQKRGCAFSGRSAETFLALHQ